VGSIGAAPWVLKGGYALELRFKEARSTVDIDLTLQPITAPAGVDQNQVVHGMLQRASDVNLGDWFEYVVRPAIMDFTAPYGGTMDGSLVADVEEEAVLGGVEDMVQGEGQFEDPRLGPR